MWGFYTGQLHWLYTGKSKNKSNAWIDVCKIPPSGLDSMSGEAVIWWLSDYQMNMQMKCVMMGVIGNLLGINSDNPLTKKAQNAKILGF